MIFCVISAEYGDAVGKGFTINEAYENACEIGDHLSDNLRSETQITFWESEKKLPVNINVAVTFESREI